MRLDDRTSPQMYDRKTKDKNKGRPQKEWWASSPWCSQRQDDWRPHPRCGGQPGAEQCQSPSEPLQLLA
eukprot:4473946-Pyramimonas_sp.AAC.1